MQELELLAAYLDRNLSQGDVSRLEDWLRASDENVQAFVDWSILQSDIEAYHDASTIFDQIGLTLDDAPHQDDTFKELMRYAAEARDKTEAAQRAAAQADNDGLPRLHPSAETEEEKQGPLVIVIPRLAVWGSIAAAILLAFVLFWPNDTKSPSTTPGPDDIAQQEPSALPVAFHATLEQAIDVEWDDSLTPRIGELLPKGEHRLLKGLIALRLAKGTDVILEAPVQFEVLGDNAIHLQHGRLVADVPKAGHGFTVRTPAAEVVDLGTRFGVEVRERGLTETHVFDGVVEFASRSETNATVPVLSLRENQAAAVGPNDTDVRLIDYAEERFVREIVVPLDVVDLLAGGDGRQRNTNAGFDPSSGKPITQASLPQTNEQFQYPAKPGYHRVADNAFLDGVFIPQKGWDPVTVNSVGLAYAGLEEAMTSTFCPIWAGDFVPQRRRENVSAEFDPDAINRVFSRADAPEDSPRLLVMHSPKGLTLDLDAIRQQHPGLVPTRLTSQIANGGDRIYGYQEDIAKRYGPDTLTQADCLVLIDGQVRKQFRGIKTNQPPQQLDVNIRPGDRFLTIITTSGADQHNEYDWLLFNQPTIELRPASRETQPLN